MDQNTPVSALSGIGEARAKKLEKLGITTMQHLVGYYPRAYEDRTHIYAIDDAPPDQKVCIQVIIAEAPRLVRIRKGMELVQVKAVDERSTLYVTFFNQSYVQKILRSGETYILYGTVEARNYRRTMSNPVFEHADRQVFTGRIMPIYHLTQGISNHMLCTLTAQASAECSKWTTETLPERLLTEHGLAPLVESLQQVHFPDSQETLERARRRLAFEELFYFSAGLAYLKKRRTAEVGLSLPPVPLSRFEALLPFSLTGAQRRVMEQICGDLSCGSAMNRLIQGDVGSGKTVVAAYAVYMTAKAGYQAAMMAPTEILAEQHFRTLSALLSPVGIRVGLLTGSLRAKERRALLAQLLRGEVDLLVGTHALFSEDVVYQNLALIIADEQHRFGVAQRAALAEKATVTVSTAPHTLVMSATPIPRTLALMIYGDLEVSVIDELPPGRTPVDTFVVHEDKRQRMYEFVRKLVGEGRQVYIVCPAVEEAEESDEPVVHTLKSAKAFQKELQDKVFPTLRLALLHGKMQPREKERTMRAFAAGEIDILVATTVIEVGVDVANAALMIVENAERFGLSQLHQLRGRVGRGAHHSYCVLMTPSHANAAMERLKTLAGTNDGFRISEEDLKLRGPGDFFGNRQHGLPQLHIADLSGDLRTLTQAQEAARSLIEDDPDLKKEENRHILAHIRRLFSENSGTFN